MLTFKTLFLFARNVPKNHIALVIHITLGSDSPLRCVKNLLERIYKIIMTIDDKIREKKRYNTASTEEQQRCQHHHQVKLINRNLLEIEMV